MENNQTMKASELRIGNYFNNNGFIMQVSPNTILEVWKSERQWCESIPLTEEWLLRMGAQRNRDGWYLSANYMLYNPLTHLDVRSSEYYALMYNDKIITTNAIQYVHQLQNLYFALTGQELEIKEL